MNLFYELISEKHAISLSTAMLLSTLEVAFVAFDWWLCLWLVRQCPTKKYYTTVFYFVLACGISAASFYNNLSAVDPSERPFALFCAELAQLDVQWVGRVLDKKLHFDLFLESNYLFVPFFYFLMMILLLMVTLYRRHRVMRIKNCSNRVRFNAAWNPHFQVLRKKLDIKRPVAVVDSPLVQRSMFYASWHSLVLLPSAALCEKPNRESEIAALEAFLAIKNIELGIRIALWIFVLLFAFNPVIWFLGWQVIVQRRRLLHHRAQKIQISLVDELYPVKK